MLGVTAYRTAFARPRAAVGPQDDLLGPARLWILPNPSGLNAHWLLPALANAFAELREAAKEARPSNPPTWSMVHRPPKSGVDGPSTAFTRLRAMAVKVGYSSLLP